MTDLATLLTFWLGSEAHDVAISYISGEQLVREQAVVIDTTEIDE